jgi:hypothetical protein
VCVKHFSPLSTGDLDECRTLLRNGANIDRPGPTGMTPVMIAITQGHIKVRETIYRKEGRRYSPKGTSRWEVGDTLHTSYIGSKIQLLNLKRPR